MKNKLMLGALLLLAAAAAFGRQYDLDDTAEVDLRGVDELVFDLRGLSCSLCVRTLDIESEIAGDGSGGAMTLNLSGSITSNRDKAVPSLVVEETGRMVTVRLYPRGRSFFGLSQSGRAMFAATVPESFGGAVSVVTSSDDLVVRDFSVGGMDVRSSSGDMTVRNVSADEVDLRISSGDFRGDGLSAS
ncbi:MAG: DUF4097 domain-containing protein, partial [Desulfobacterales bacterium]|nr:DUF4097 domain-containing protein [Desulfobacterales bacterium]